MKGLFQSISNTYVGIFILKLGDLLILTLKFQSKSVCIDISHLFVILRMLNITKNIKIMQKYNSVIFFRLHFFTGEHLALTFFMLNIEYAAKKFRRSRLGMEKKSQLTALRTRN